MPDLEQERRCILLALPFLAEDFGVGGGWAPPVGLSLNESLPHIATQPASPEVVVTNGLTTAAIEVKRLTGGPSWDRHYKSANRLQRSLLPAGGGRFWLEPSIGFELRISDKLQKILRSEIGEIGPKLLPGGSGAVSIPRRGILRSLGTNARNDCIVDCYCGVDNDEIRRAGTRVSGIFELEDSEPIWGHSFVTAAARSEFQDHLVAHCMALHEGESREFAWKEEWRLTRSVSNGPDGVGIMTAVIGDVVSEFHYEIEARLASVNKKFNTKWAEKHVLILERTGVSFATPDDIRDVLQEVKAQNVDLVLLVDGDKVTRIAS